MATITAGLVKELREKTGAGMMEAKKALVETDGDFEKAITYLKEKGLIASAKKADRIAAEGVVAIALDSNYKTASVIEVNSETDFVAKNESFKIFAKEMVNVVNENNFNEITDLHEHKHNGLLVKDYQSQLVSTIGEKIEIRRFKKVQGEFVYAYLHTVNNRIATVVTMTAENKDALKSEIFINFAKDVTMQIAASAPKYLVKEEVKPEEVEEEKRIMLLQLQEEGKEGVMAEKIVLGKLNKWYGDICLMNQVFFKEDKKTVTDVLKEVEKELNTKIAIQSFVRFEVGEGLEKRKDNFAEEVAAQLKR